MDAIRPLTKAIRAIPSRRGVWDPNEALSAFVHMALSLTTKAVNILEGCPIVADYYSAITESAPEVSVNAGKALAVAVDTYLCTVMDQPPWTDVLSLVHADFLGQFGGNGLGQHFTPWDVADLCGGLAVDHFKRYPIKGRDHYRVYEPACGAGGLLLGHLRCWEGPTQKLTVVANDLDPLCSAMTALQLLANQALHQRFLEKCVVTVGNALIRTEEVGFASAMKVHVEASKLKQAAEIA